MNIIERVKNILLSPKTEWDVVRTETATPQSLLMAYVIPLAVVAALGSLLKGLFFAGTAGIMFFIITAVITLVSTAVSFFVSVIIVDMLAPSFDSEKNMGRSAQLVAYAFTPFYVGSLLSFLPFVGMLISLAALAYGIYLMYLGIGPMKKTPEDKKIVYMIVVFLIWLVIYFVLIAILGAILFAAMGITAAATGLLG